MRQTLQDGWASNWTLNYLQASKTMMQVTCRISFLPQRRVHLALESEKLTQETWSCCGPGRCPTPSGATRSTMTCVSGNSAACQCQLLSTKRIWLLHFYLMNFKQNFSADPNPLCKEENSGKYSPTLAKLA